MLITSILIYLIIGIIVAYIESIIIIKNVENPKTDEDKELQHLLGLVPNPNNVILLMSLISTFIWPITILDIINYALTYEKD